MSDVNSHPVRPVLVVLLDANVIKSIKSVNNYSTFYILPATV